MLFARSSSPSGRVRPWSIACEAAAAQPLFQPRGGVGWLEDVALEPDGYADGRRAMLTNVTFTTSSRDDVLQGWAPKQVVNLTVPVPWQGKRSAVGIGLEGP